MTDWVAGIQPDHLDLAAGLRGQAGLRAARTRDTIWIRGPLLEGKVPPKVHREILKIPDVTVYFLENGQLRPLGRRLFYGPAPVVDWEPIRQVFSVSLPATVLPGTTSSSSSHNSKLKLVPASNPREANLLLTSPDKWLTYVESCTRVRLAPLTYAFDPEGNRVLIRGTPLPPLPGKFFYVLAGTALPCGFQWDLQVDEKTVRNLVACAWDDLVLFNPDASCEIIPATGFVKATRSSVRLTIREGPCV